MIRLAVAPDGRILPDVGAKLPGRGLWIEADRAALEAAIAERKFVRAAARSLKSAVRPEDVPSDLADRIERLLAERALDRLGLERRAGRLVAGFEKVRSALKQGGVGVLLEARDAASDGRRKLRFLAAPETMIASAFTRDQMGLALGRENVVHAAVSSGGGAERLKRDIHRLAAYRGEPLAEPL